MSAQVAPVAPPDAKETAAWAGHIGEHNVVAELFSSSSQEALLVHVLKDGCAFRGLFGSPCHEPNRRDREDDSKRALVDMKALWGHQAATRGESAASRALKLMRTSARSTSKIVLCDGSRNGLTGAHDELREPQKKGPGTRLEILHSWGTELGKIGCHLRVADIDLYAVPTVEFFDALFSRVERGRKREQEVRTEVARLEEDVAELSAAESVLQEQLAVLEQRKIEAVASGALNEFKRTCRTCTHAVL